MQRYVQWLAASSVVAPPVEFVGRTTVATTVIAKHDLLSSTPLEVCMVADSPDALAERLVAEKQKGESSLWWPYVDMLPQSFPEMPLFWKDEEVAAVQDDEVAAAVLGDPTRPAVQSAPDFAWAKACVLSRAAAIDDTDQVALVPMLDAFNHSPWVDDTHSSTDGRAIVLRSSGSFRVGEEVHVKYGKLTNAQLLVDFGMVWRPRPHDPQPMNPDDQAVLRVDTLTGPVRTTINADGAPTKGSLARLRGAFLSPTERSALFADPNASAAAPARLAVPRKVSTANEEAVRTALRSALSRAVVAADGAGTPSKALVATFNQERTALLRRALAKLGHPSVRLLSRGGVA